MKVLLCLDDALPVRFKVPEGASMASFERGVRERLGLDEAMGVNFLCDGGRAAVRAVEDLEEGEQILVDLGVRGRGASAAAPARKRWPDLLRVWRRSLGWC